MISTYSYTMRPAMFHDYLVLEIYVLMLILRIQNSYNNNVQCKNILHYIIMFILFWYSSIYCFELIESTIPVQKNILGPIYFVYTF